jgi:hypothetical protein
MAKQNRGRVRVLQHGKIKQTRIKEGRWSELCFLFFFFLFCFFLKVQKVKATLKDPPVSRLRV